MTTSQMPSSLIEALQSDRLSVGVLEYFRSRLKSRLHQLVVNEFLQREDKGLKQKELANRIGKRPDVVNRLLGASGNWTLDTVSDLLLGMNAELELSAVDLTWKEPTAARKGIDLAVMLGTSDKGQPEVKIPTPSTREPEKQGRPLQRAA